MSGRLTTSAWAQVRAQRRRLSAGDSRHAVAPIDRHADDGGMRIVSPTVYAPPIDADLDQDSAK